MENAAQHSRRQEDEGRRQGDGQERRQSLPEKVTLFISLAIVLVLIGYIGWHGLFVAKGTPMIEPRVRREAAKRQGGQWVIPVEVRNLSDLPLEDIQVKVEITTPEGARTDMDLSFPYLAERATETARIVTALEPEKAAPEATVESFKEQKDSSGY